MMTEVLWLWVIIFSKPQPEVQTSPDLGFGQHVQKHLRVPNKKRLAKRSLRVQATFGEVLTKGLIKDKCRLDGIVQRLSYAELMICFLTL